MPVCLSTNRQNSVKKKGEQPDFSSVSGYVDIAPLGEEDEALD